MKPLSLSHLHIMYNHCAEFVHPPSQKVRKHFYTSPKTDSMHILPCAILTIRYLCCYLQQKGDGQMDGQVNKCVGR